MDASAPPKVHQSIPRRSIWFLACTGRAVLLFVGWALLSCHPFVYISLRYSTSRALTLMTGLTSKLQVFVKQVFQLSLPPQLNVFLFECLRKRLKIAKDSSSLVRQWKRESLNIRPRLFLIDRVSILILFQRQVLTVTAVIPYIVLVQVLQNLPTPPKH